MHLSRHLSYSTLIALMLSSSPGAAIDKQMEMSANAAANCQGALPNFEGSIRKRPLGVQNEGSESAFVTCAFASQYDVAAVTDISHFAAFFVNKGTAEATVACTGVAGFETGESNVYISKSITVAPNSTVHAFLQFWQDDNGGESFYPLVSMSCKIPPGVGINDTYVGYTFNDE